VSTLRALSLSVLSAAEPADKLAAVKVLSDAWKSGDLSVGPIVVTPDRPARPELPIVMAPKHMPKRTYAGVAGRIALVHALAHIEFNAIDLACDIVCRDWGLELPASFYDDWIVVACEEALHFVMLQDLLETLGAQYGDLPAHDGLWQAAEKTAHDLMARLAIVPLTLEARGLDTTPNGIEKLRRNNDNATADVLEIIYQDEIKHVAAGVRWFKYMAHIMAVDCKEQYQTMLELYFPGGLKPPFNDHARALAQMPASWYSSF
jgi:uncharacterized ferritin-like protein (DUF455 family)